MTNCYHLLLSYAYFAYYFFQHISFPCFSMGFWFLYYLSIIFKRLSHAKYALKTNSTLPLTSLEYLKKRLNWLTIDLSLSNTVGKTASLELAGLTTSSKRSLLSRKRVWIVQFIGEMFMSSTGRAFQVYGRIGVQLRASSEDRDFEKVSNYELSSADALFDYDSGLEANKSRFLIVLLDSLHCWNLIQFLKEGKTLPPSDGRVHIHHLIRLHVVFIQPHEAKNLRKAANTLTAIVCKYLSIAHII